MEYKQTLTINVDLKSWILQHLISWMKIIFTLIWSGVQKPIPVPAVNGLEQKVLAVVEAILPLESPKNWQFLLRFKSKSYKTWVRYFNFKTTHSCLDFCSNFSKLLYYANPYIHHPNSNQHLLGKNFWILCHLVKFKSNIIWILVFLWQSLRLKINPGKNRE